MKTVGVELCAGTLVVGLTALAGRPVRALTGYMGGKQRWASDLARVAYGQIDELIAVDAGPWGDVWASLVQRDVRWCVESILRSWAARGSLVEWWPLLAAAPPYDDPAERAAQYLCLQARSASCIPVWWDARERRWVAPTGSRLVSSTRGAQQKRPACGVGTAATAHGSHRLSTANPRRQPTRGLTNIATLADRVAALDCLPMDRIKVVRRDVAEVVPVPGSRVFFDPPYEGCPRYAALCPRERVLSIARRHAAVAERVTVCEAERLPLAGWEAERIAHREWVTTWGVRQRVGRQVEMFGGGA